MMRGSEIVVLPLIDVNGGQIYVHRVGYIDRHPSRTRSCCATLAAGSLLTELDAFFTEHRRCDDLDAGVYGLTVCVWLRSEHGETSGRVSSSAA
jgi:hypothetical protein